MALKVLIQQLELIVQDSIQDTEHDLDLNCVLSPSLDLFQTGRLQKKNYRYDRMMASLPWPSLLMFTAFQPILIVPGSEQRGEEKGIINGFLSLMAV